MANFTQFTAFPIFCHQSISFWEKSQIFSFPRRGGVHWPIFLDLQLFELFHTKVAQNDPQWWILPPKWLGLVQNGQFWLNFNKHLNIPVESWLICIEPSEQGLFFWIFWVFQLFQIVSHRAGQNDPQWPILPKNSLDWLKTANFDHFAGLPIFSPKMRLRLTQNGQFHPIHNFSYLLPPKCLISGEISKKFVPEGTAIMANFLSFKTFLNCFTSKQLKMTHNGELFQKGG